MPRLRVLALLACLLVGGCSSAGDDHTTTGHARWRLDYEPGPAIPLGAVVPRVSLVGHSALFPFTDHPVGPVDSLGSLDLSTGKRTVLARSGFRGGSIVDVLGIGGDIVYVEVSARFDHDPERAPWRVIALRGHRVLASSDRPTAIPDLEVIDDSVVWTVQPEQGEPRAFGWRPGSAVGRREVLPGDELECTPPAPDATLVGGCDRRDGWLAWVQHASSSEQGGALFAARADSGNPHRIGTVRYDLGGPVVFGDYVLWDSGRGLRVTSLRHRSATAEVRAGSGQAGTFLGPGGDDDSAVLLTQEDGTTTMRVLDADHLHLTRTPNP